MNQPDPGKKILLDCDVIIHFLKGEQILVLPKIFPGQFVILDIVKNELTKYRSLASTFENFLNFSKIEVVSFTGNMDILREYARLKTNRGEGESACLAVARFEDKYISSSNLKDIKAYCELHNIVYFTTMDLICFALEKKILTETDCNEFIRLVKQKGSKLPDIQIKNYPRRF